MGNGGVLDVPAVKRLRIWSGKTNTRPYIGTIVGRDPECHLVRRRIRTDENDCTIRDVLLVHRRIRTRQLFVRATTPRNYYRSTLEIRVKPAVRRRIIQNDPYITCLVCSVVARTYSLRP